MSPTTGASLNGLFHRCLGTVIGGVIALAVWYMVVGKSAGVIVLSLVALAPRISYHSYYISQQIITGFYKIQEEYGLFLAIELMGRYVRF